jgi:hypothetical protein
MIKLKSILSEAYAWERKEGQPLPTLKDVQEAYDAKGVEDAVDEAEEGAKPDYIDLDKDGDEEESMKDAAKDAEAEDDMNEQIFFPIGGDKSSSKSLNFKKEFQLDLSTVNVGDVLEAYGTDPDQPIGRGTVVAVDNSGKRVELSDIEVLKKMFDTRGSKRGLNKVFSVGPNGKLNGFKIAKSIDINESFWNRVKGNLHGHEYILREAFRK